jgi:anaerobic magnesium-protoporphyrin IX monomethyl ester cyclase
MQALDCLVLGFYDYAFDRYVEMVRAMGEASGAFRDLALAFVQIESRPLRALDVITRFRDETIGTAPPLHNTDFLWPAVAYLTSYLRRRGFDVDYVNLPHLEPVSLDRALQQPVRAVAITTTLYVSPHPILKLVEDIRRSNNDVTIVVGGPYISNQARLLSAAEEVQLFEFLGADVYVRCIDGEATLAAVLGALRSGAPLDDVPNVAFRGAGGRFTFTPLEPESNDLSEDVIDYRQFGADLGEFLSIRTARSCPFSCRFCGFPERGGGYRFLDVAAVERQLDLVAAAGRVTTLSFIDDTFNVPKARFKELLRMMIRKRYPFRWNCFYRSDHGDAEAIELMASAGCEGVFLGVESGSDAMLAAMNKSSRRHHYLEAIPRLRNAGLSTYASFIVGFPGESAQSVEQTLDLIERARPDYYRAQLWYADPLTPVWRDREKHGIVGAGFNWTHHTMTAGEAADWVERIFFAATGSEWLPQFGFEHWSLYYLARKGMSRQQIRAFVATFNDAVKHRLRTGRPEVPSPLLDRFRSLCRFGPVAAAPDRSAAGGFGRAVPAPVRSSPPTPWTRERSN